MMPGAGIEVEVTNFPELGASYTLGVEFAAWERDVQTFYRVDAPSDPMDPTMHIVGLEVGVKL